MSCFLKMRWSRFPEVMNRFTHIVGLQVLFVVRKVEATTHVVLKVKVRQKSAAVVIQITIGDVWNNFK